MQPRVCVPSWRAFNRAAFNCSLFEFQDVLAETGDADVIYPQPGAYYPLVQKWHRRMLYHDRTGLLARLNPGLERVRLTRDYEVFVAICQTFWDLVNINAIEDWEARCKTSVCWINEIWAATIPHYQRALSALDRFDHVFVSLKASATVLSTALGRKCHWLPAGVDALRFSPYPEPSERVVDVYSIGRRRSGVHDALLRMTEARPFFYLHDTLDDMATMVPLNAEQHRTLYANVAKRSRYFMVAPAKVDDLSDSRGESEIGFRYYEGAAAGAVLLGEVPTCGHYAELFGWPEAVVEVNPDGSDTPNVIAQLDAQPERVDGIRRRNAAQALLQHDWVYRWKEIFRIAGFEPSDGMRARERRLLELATMASAPVVSLSTQYAAKR